MSALFDGLKEIVQAAIGHAVLCAAIAGLVYGSTLAYDQYTKYYPQPVAAPSWMKSCETIEKQIIKLHDQQIKDDYRIQSEINTDYRHLDEILQNKLLELHEKNRAMGNQIIARTEKMRDEVCALEAAERAQGGSDR